jgi:hypothetical protein
VHCKVRGAGGVEGRVTFPASNPVIFPTLTLNKTMAKSDLSAHIAAAIHAIGSGECVGVAKPPLSE